jgi:hypothetical protein
MKLTYRGQFYTITAPAQFGADADSTGPKVKLIYRGQTYYATHRPAATAETTSATGSTVTLQYRGITYQRVLQDLKPYHPGRAINWRYQLEEG